MIGEDGFQVPAANVTAPRPHPTIPEVAPLIDAYGHIEANWNGGALHIVLADQNIDHDHVLWCQGEALARGDHRGAVLAGLLLKMSWSQRKKISHLPYKTWPGAEEEFDIIAAPLIERWLTGAPMAASATAGPQHPRVGVLH